MFAKVVLAVLTLITIVGCINLPENVNLLPTGTPFAVQGTATILVEDGPCPAWIGENGVTYHLFQDPTLDSVSFDLITTPGTTARLVLVTRTDLEVTCGTGTIVEVQDVLVIIE